MNLARRLWRNCRTVILCLQPDTRTGKPVLLDTESGETRLSFWRPCEFRRELAELGRRVYEIYR